MSSVPVNSHNVLDNIENRGSYFCFTRTCAAQPEWRFDVECVEEEGEEEERGEEKQERWDRHSDKAQVGTVWEGERPRGFGRDHEEGEEVTPHERVEGEAGTIQRAVCGSYGAELDESFDE